MPIKRMRQAVMLGTWMSDERGVSLDCRMGFELLLRLKILQKVVEVWKARSFFELETTTITWGPFLIQCAIMRAKSNAHRASLIFPFLRHKNFVSCLGEEIQKRTKGILVHPGTMSNEMPRWGHMYSNSA